MCLWLLHYVTTEKGEILCPKYCPLIRAAFLSVKMGI